jgi:hypothetical protein
MGCYIIGVVDLGDGIAIGFGEVGFFSSFT